MIKTIIKKTIPDYENTSDLVVRNRYVQLSSVIGILCNLFLFIIKIVIGIMSQSIAIISDAFNSLSDFGSSLISLIASKYSNKPADKEHPFGHGRIEYLATMSIGMIIFYVGVQLLLSSIEKIYSPKSLILSIWVYIIIIVSLLVKLWLMTTNKLIGQTINSKLVLALVSDSFNDVVSNLILLVVMLFMKLTTWNLDGVAGIAISLIILYNGYRTLKDISSRLLGINLNPTLVSAIEEEIEKSEDILGYHNLQVHDYGPGRIHASIDVEIPDNLTLIEAHKIIDKMEEDLSNKLRINCVIHMDPISSNVYVNNELLQKLEMQFKQIDASLQIKSIKLIQGHLRSSAIVEATTKKSNLKELANHLIQQNCCDNPTLKLRLMLSNENTSYDTKEF